MISLKCRLLPGGLFQPTQNIRLLYKYRSTQLYIAPKKLIASYLFNIFKLKENLNLYFLIN
ncbi:hypothetical protein CKK33_13520 [Mucilaginibacter sp. MD40]|nr:hypothetical protein CKK33_13520 [Mucilaginibacter sp. MD40]